MVSSGTSVPGLAVPGLAVPGGAPAPPAVNAFTLAFVAGDNTSAGQAFAPSGWTALPAVTASNGVDHTCDVVLTAAWTVTSAAVSVTGTATSAEDLSGSIIGVQVDAPSPIPDPEDSGVAPGWAGRTILEAAIGSGFQTPADEMTWVTLNDSALTPAEQEAAGQPKCFWAWDETSTGIPDALGQLQSSEGSVTLDNAPGSFTPSNPDGLDITTGTPMRLRIALGTVDGVAVNRWYAWQRNASTFTEQRDEDLRSYVTAGLTDGWSVASVPCPTPYRGEIIAEPSLYSWFAMDDQPLSGGVQPASLVNSAPGNTTTMAIIASPSGVTAGAAYTTAGSPASSPLNIPPGVAVSAVGQQQGWMYGDPQSSPSAYSTGNPVTSSPGSAAWQQTGLLGSGGANTWFLAAGDPGLPPLAGGITVKGWFNAEFAGSATGWEDASHNYWDIAGQPYSVITLATLSTGSAPVAMLQLDLSGHLQLLTFSGATPTSHAIYAGSDLRSSSWHCIDLMLTATTWTVAVDGGLTATVSGTASGMTSAWSWLTLNGDYGNTHGGTSPGQIQHGGNVAYSHWTVFSAELPAWRLASHYSAAITGFGVLPAPQTVAASAVSNQQPTGFTPDGTLSSGNYGAAITAFTFSVLAAATAGAYTSGPSARSVIAGVGQFTASVDWASAVWASFTGLAPSFTLYTSASAAAETAAATVCGSGDSFSSGFGSGAADAGVCSTGGGSGAAPPSGPTPLGDAVAQRIERVLQYGGLASPNRAIDASAAELVHAATDVGGQACGANVQNVVSSDYGLFFVDNQNTTSYRSRSWLNSDSVVWYLSSAGPGFGIPYQVDMDFGNDPQYVANVIQIAPFSPDQATLPVITPASAAAANASVRQYGPRPLSLGTVNYLQDPAKIQSAADWLLATYGSLERRVLTLRVDAAGHPGAWEYVAAATVGDQVQVTDLPLSGGPLSVGAYRISNMAKKMSGEANGGHTEASLTITADPVVTYFS